MAVFGLTAKFDGTEAQAGLERLNTAAEKFGKDLQRNLGTGSISGILTSLAAGFGALQIKDSIVNAYKEMADEAVRAADASERMAAAVNTRFRANSNDEGRLGNTRGNLASDKAELNLVRSQMGDFKDKYGIDYRSANPIVAAVHSFTHPEARSYFNSLISKESTLNERIQSGQSEQTGEVRALTKQNRLAGYEHGRTEDEREVAMGRLSRSGAQQREIDRLSGEYATSMADPTQSAAQRSAARSAVDKAQNGMIPIQAQENFNRLQGIMPQIAASSLARIGGGGNVNVLGGREGALETEARLHSNLLRTIAANTGKGGTLGDVR